MRMLPHSALVLLAVASATLLHGSENTINFRNGRRSSGTVAEGFTRYSELGRGYKLMETPATWHTARDKCAEEGGNLAVPRSMEEFMVLQAMMRRLHGAGARDMVRVAWLGVNNIDDHTVWVDLEGDDIKKSDFHLWADNNGQTLGANPAEPHCAGMDGHNIGLREWWCERDQPYLCEVALDEQGRDVPWVPALGKLPSF